MVDADHSQRPPAAGGAAADSSVTASPAPASPPRVVIIGAGFAGLAAAEALRGAPVQTTIVDRHNYNTFQPLLYQVATVA